ncbi:MAG TPA: acyl-CoA dehydrogenase [Rhizobiales bacterium]|nr:acyl-CoA dehydrogenase [Hyphomicrobiales bacterium]
MTYTAPVAEISAALNDIAGLSGLIEDGLFPDLDPGLVAAILEEAGKFASERIAPLNRQGDVQGATLENDEVRMPEGWRDVYRQWCEAGWAGLAGPGDYGGQGLPVMMSMAVGEMWQSACMSFALNPMLTQGAAETIAQFGCDELKQSYLPKMVPGEWAGTMLLTEPHAGSDLSTLKTMARPRGDGGYLLSGTKIFITFGEHDLVDNIVHLVLARTPDAPPGTGGISLFLVPKYLINSDGSLGERNDVHCLSLEHKLGIHASPTCVMRMGDKGGAKGWLVGEETRGLAAMFTMMNRARLAVGVQGAAIAERAFQRAQAFARERKQGRGPDGRQTAIVNHPDVRRMLLSMKAKTAASRAICFMTARMIDIAERGSDETAHAMASLLTPVAKAFSTDMGVEVACEGVQVHGGMGYIEETGAAQYLRDARIAPIYEGTNGIQAIDLVVRKLPLDGGEAVRSHIASLREIVAGTNASDVPEFGGTAACLEDAVAALEEATAFLLGKLSSDAATALAGASAYLRLFGIASGAVYMAKGALKQTRGENAGAGGAVALARYYAENHAVEAPGLAKSIIAGGSWVLPDAADALAG